MRLSSDFTQVDDPSWDPVGTGATPAEERYAQDKLREVLRAKVKEWGPRTEVLDYKRDTVYLGVVDDFFPRAHQIDYTLANITVVFDPSVNTCAADTNGALIRVGKMGFKHQGTSRSLGATFIHEVEHCLDAIRGHYLGGRGHGTPRGERAVSEFTPRLRQLLRHLKDEPDFRIWNYLHRKHGQDHAENYVDHFLNTAKDYLPTLEEREFAAKAVIKRAQEIFDHMIATNPNWQNKPG